MTKITRWTNILCAFILALNLSSCSWEQNTQLNPKIKSVIPLTIVDHTNSADLIMTLKQVLRQNKLFDPMSDTTLTLHHLSKQARTVSTGNEGDPRLKRLQYQVTFSLETPNEAIIPKTIVSAEYDLYEQFNQTLQDASEYEHVNHQLIQSLVYNILVRFYLKDSPHVLSENSQ